MSIDTAKIEYVDENSRLICEGSWTVMGLSNVSIDKFLSTLDITKPLVIDGQKISSFDSAGAVFVQNIKQYVPELKLEGFSKSHQEMLDLVEKHEEAISYEPQKPVSLGMLDTIGRESIAKVNQLDGLLVLIGDLTVRFISAVGNWKRFQCASILSIMESAGIYALPIVGLLSFLVGIVLAYQMGLQLQTYGANIFIALLSGLAVFREFGPLITAIIVAGRTSSAFTAQLGSMKVNEEVDALLTMGLSPTEMLVMPRVIAMVIMFPLLIFWADIFGILGSMFMSKHMLDVNYADFLARIKDSVGLDQLMLGLYKAPVFAMIVALVGCYQGFNVGSSANSIGEKTTKSVVQALFLIIIADAIYSIIYSWLDL